MACYAASSSSMNGLEADRFGRKTLTPSSPPFSFFSSSDSSPLLKPNPAPPMLFKISLKLRLGFSAIYFYSSSSDSSSYFGSTWNTGPFGI